MAGSKGIRLCSQVSEPRGSQTRVILTLCQAGKESKPSGTWWGGQFAEGKEHPPHQGPSSLSCDQQKKNREGAKQRFCTKDGRCGQTVVQQCRRQQEGEMLRWEDTVLPTCAEHAPISVHLTSTAVPRSPGKT